MRIINALIAITLLSFMLGSCSNKRPGKPRILVFSKTTGFHHSSIPAGQQAILELGEAHGFLVDTTQDAGYFNEDSLDKYAAVVFLNTTDYVDSLLNHYQQNAFERYIQAGGGFVGVHAAADAGYHWGWYGRLVGAYFLSHPEQQEAVLKVMNRNHPATGHLPEEWVRKDEWYDFKEIQPDLNILITIDESSYQNGRNGDFHPMAWYHEFDGGRSFYTALGHTEESYQEAFFLQHLLGGIQYAIGDNLKLNYKKVTTLKTPEEERFTKTILKQGPFFEPTEFTILPNLDILIVQRRGEVLFYNHEDTSLTEAGKLAVYHKTSVAGVNAEEGLMGVQADPDFATNHFVYLFYAPIDTSVNRLSRFVLENGKLDMSSEKIILQFYSQREICCHTGGSIAFGDDHLLYLSTGDNTTPFNEPGQKYVSAGYGPMDDRPGHEQYDARRSSANTNDLRGKILRIKINPDGSYDIPEGNLFPPGTEKTRPEIYVMGTRNPYRISIDRATGFLYWGEVGPDAGVDSSTRGPRGYDELNQARQAGFFGWPLFVGNNYPYRSYDYATGESGDYFDPAKPINNSRNNTGLTELPPVSPAFIYYPYAPSKEFPQLGSGGRNAMAGPVIHSTDEKAIPLYYNNKLFMYDWMRGWIKVVTLRPNGDFDKMEPFMPSTPLNNLIDMEIGPDGKLYFLEYGKGWFTANPEAAVSRIDYYSGDLATRAAAGGDASETPLAVDSAEFEMGHQQHPEISRGKKLVEILDCMNCHKTDEKSIGPTYMEVAAKYKNEKAVNDQLVSAMIKGSSGVWGETAMPAHPTLSEDDAAAIVQWIHSLREE